MPPRPQRLRPVLCLAVLAWSCQPGSARAQSAAPGADAAGVIDSASLFGKEAAGIATEQLQDLEKSIRLKVVVKTVATLEGQPVETASSNALALVRPTGLLVLIDKKEHKIDVRATPAAQDAFPRATLNTIRDAFLAPFKKQDFDRGLSEGVLAIERAVGTTRFGATPAAASPLVARNQTRLNLAGARLILAGAEAKARELGLHSDVAVVDDGGHLLAFERMDGARPASIYTAITKATTAATFRQETGPMPKGAPAPDPLLSLSLENAAAASGGKLTTLLGGVPLLVDGQVIGAVGVGGGTGAQDAEVAKAGIAHFAAALGAPAGPEPSPNTKP